MCAAVEAVHRVVVGRQESVEDRLALHGYKVEEQLGTGSYSRVHRAWSRSHDDHVALKLIDRRKVTPRLREHFLPRELAIIEKLHHPNIIAALQVLHVSHYLCMVEELAANGHLLAKIKHAGRLAEPRARPMVRQLLEALRYLHEQGVVHRDLKCENVLLDKYDNVKLSDFTFCRYMGPNDLSSTFCGSLGYVAPEIIREHPYQGRAVDFWSLGVVLYMLVTGIFPFNNRNLARMLEGQQMREIRYPRPVSPEVRELIYHLLDPNPQQRADYNRTLNSDWLSNTQWTFRTSRRHLARIATSHRSWSRKFNIRPIDSKHKL